MRDRVVSLGVALMPPPQPQYRLTPRELEVLTWVARGKTAAEVSQILDIAGRTVDGHVAAAMEKLGARTRAHAVAIAMSQQLITP